MVEVLGISPELDMAVELALGMELAQGI